MAAWKHASTSYVEQNGVDPVEKDRGAEQGDVDGPLECSMVVAQVARETRMSIADSQRQGVLPWVAENGITTNAACDDYDSRAIRVQ